MATTTAVSSYRSAGQPDDGVGAVGDICFDTTNRITWVKQSNNSWVNGAYSNIGPTGPAQLSGTGAPATGLGQIGNGYCDLSTGYTYLKSSSGWAQAGSILGPSGSAMNGLSASSGQQAAIISQTLSATPTVLPIPGSSTPAQFYALSASAFMGVYCYASAACTLTLYDVTASAAVYSISLAANQTVGGTYFSTTAYPMAQGHVFQWQATGSASTSIQLLPFYLQPSSSVGLCVNALPPAGYSTAVSFSTTSVKVPPFGLTQNQSTWAHSPPRQGGVYSVQATYAPSGGTTSSSSVQLVLNYGNNSTGSGGALSGVSLGAVTATGLSQTLLAPRLSDFSSLTTGNFYYFTATGSGTGTLLVTLLALV